MANPIGCEAARTRTNRIFITEETTPGTPVDAVTGDYVPVTGDPSEPIPFGRADLEDLSRGEGLSPMPNVQGQTIPQSFDYSTYLFHADNAGDVPFLGQLWEALYGVETINGGTDVTYSPLSSDENLKSYTVLIKSDNTAMRFSARMNNGVPQVNPSDGPDAVVGVNWSMDIFNWHYYIAGKASGTSATGVISFSDIADAARFMVGSIVEVDSTKTVVDAVDTSLGTIDVTPAPSDGAVDVLPWAPAVPVLSDLDNRCLAHKAELLISTVSGETPFIFPTRNMTPSFLNNLITVFDETGRDIGEGCTYRTEKRTNMIDANVKAYAEFAELIAAAAQDKTVTAQLSIPGASDPTRSVKFKIGTNGTVRVRLTGNPSNENGIKVYPVQLQFSDPTGGDDAMETVFD